VESILTLVIATAVLVLIPGPNVALIVANSLRYGLKLGLITSLGTTAGIAFQLALVVVGLAAIIEMAASALEWIRWLGVVYLVYLGIRAWRETDNRLDGVQSQSKAGAFWRGFAFAVVNPKTLLFNAAFLPQFIASSQSAAGQLILLACVYLAVIVIGDALWAVFASSARRFLGKYGDLRNRITGGFLLGAAAGLALSRRPV
jgi:threonine/homoserine/homoserine lactone efflux protein